MPKRRDTHSAATRFPFSALSHQIATIIFGHKRNNNIMWAHNIAIASLLIATSTTVCGFAPAVVVRAPVSCLFVCLFVCLLVCLFVCLLRKRRATTTSAAEEFGNRRGGGAWAKNNNDPLVVISSFPTGEILDASLPTNIY